MIEWIEFMGQTYKALAKGVFAERGDLRRSGGTVWRILGTCLVEHENRYYREVVHVTPAGTDPRPEFATAEECIPGNESADDIVSRLSDSDRQPISGWLSGVVENTEAAEALWGTKPIAVSVSRPVTLTADAQDLRELGREVSDLKAQLKVMTEDRDEYQRLAVSRGKTLDSIGKLAGLLEA